MVKNKAVLISIGLFVLLQLIKPPVVIFIYKELTNFHPTIVNNYDLYFMVLKHIGMGSMKASYTFLFALSEILFLVLPFVLYKKLLSFHSETLN